MAQIFPKWFNILPIIIILGAVFTVLGGVMFFKYFGSPYYLEVGYQPQQPVPYNHITHADTLGMDCRYCHNHVEYGRHAQIPPTKTCMNCHIMVKPESEKLQPIRDSWDNGTHMNWVRVHNLPDYAYFNHRPHLRAGVGCISCHGDVSAMEVVRQVEPLNMGWCLDCHRKPDPHLRPVSEITNMKWEKPPVSEHEQWLKTHKAKISINPPETCSGCHR